MADIIHLILADDDEDDCLLFREAIAELPIQVGLTIFNDGDSLINHLKTNTVKSPGIIFLDLNMPRRNGMECLDFIRSSTAHSDIPVIIFSTSVNQKVAQSLKEKGAADYIQKPSSYVELKNVILQALRYVPGVN